MDFELIHAFNSLFFKSKLAETCLWAAFKLFEIITVQAVEKM